MSPEAIEIRDAAEALLSGIHLDGVPGFKFVGRVPVEEEPDDDLPALLVIATQERMQADGDANAGEPSFLAELTLAVLITVSANPTLSETDPKTARQNADDRLTDRIGIIQALLLRTPNFLRLFEGVSAINSTRVFDKAGERFFARARVEFTIQYRCSFAPIIDDDYEQTELTTRPFGASPAAPAIRTVIDQAQT